MLRIFSIVFLFAYPFAVYFFLDRFGPEVLGIALAFLFLLRYQSLWKKYRYILVLALLLMLVFFLLDSSSSVGVIKLYPVLVSLSFLSFFCASLLWPPTIVERFALEAGAEPGEALRRYARAVTIVWCVFFLLNAIVSMLITVFGDMDSWLFYNGIISYLIMGALFGGELLFRRHLMQKS